MGNNNQQDTFENAINETVHAPFSSVLSDEQLASGDGSSFELVADDFIEDAAREAAGE